MNGHGTVANNIVVPKFCCIVQRTLTREPLRLDPHIQRYILAHRAYHIIMLSFICGMQQESFGDAKLLVKKQMPYLRIGLGVQDMLEISLRLFQRAARI